MSSLKSPTVGVCGSAPFLGKLADSRGPRTALALSFVLLLTGYLGVKAMYDASEGNTKPAGGQTFLALILFQLLTGIGSEAGYCATLNVVIKSFPDKIVSSDSGSLTVAWFIPLLCVENDCVRVCDFRLRIVCFPFFYDRSNGLP